MCFDQILNTGLRLYSISILFSVSNDKNVFKKIFVIGDDEKTYSCVTCELIFKI